MNEISHPMNVFLYLIYLKSFNFAEEFTKIIKNLTHFHNELFPKIVHEHGACDDSRCR